MVTYHRLAAGARRTIQTKMSRTIMPKTNKEEW